MVSCFIIGKFTILTWDIRPETPIWNGTCFVAGSLSLLYIRTIETISSKKKTSSKHCWPDRCLLLSGAKHAAFLVSCSCWCHCRVILPLCLAWSDNNSIRKPNAERCSLWEDKVRSNEHVSVTSLECEVVILYLSLFHLFYIYKVSLQSMHSMPEEKRKEHLFWQFNILVYDEHTVELYNYVRILFSMFILVYIQCYTWRCVLISIQI